MKHTIKVKYSGNIPEARLLTGLGLDQLRILERQMSNAPGVERDGRVLDPFPGSGISIVASNTLGAREVVIHVPLPGSSKDDPRKKKKIRRCPFWGCFTLGKIVGPSRGLDMDDVGRRYDVSICDYGTGYTTILFCRTSDFATYEPGELVIVSTGWHEQGCCLNPPAKTVQYVITPLACPYQLWWEEVVL